MGSFPALIPRPAGVQYPPPPHSPAMQSDSLARKVDTAAPCGLLPTLDRPIHRDQFTGNPTSLARERRGWELPLSAEPSPPGPESSRKQGHSPVKGVGGRGLPPSAAFWPPHLTSRTFPNAQSREEGIPRNNTVLLPRPAPSSALPSATVQTLFCHQRRQSRCPRCPSQTWLSPDTGPSRASCGTCPRTPTTALQAQILSPGR